MPTPNNNPFPGLRPFLTEEDYLFFGREHQTAELVSLLRRHRFLAVVGTSGSGKSSLVRAGLLPELLGGMMHGAGSAWEVAVCRPGGNPITNLAQSLLDADLYDPDEPEALPRLLATLNHSARGLVEAYRQSGIEPASNLLIVIDQFEEIFRFEGDLDSTRDSARAFVNLLLEASQDPDVPVYVALTMRSDYLGDCSRFPGLAEAVNNGEYLIPRLGRAEIKAAIEGPVGVGGAEISNRLVQHLLNEVGDDQDQLPVLQHALMRTWDVWARDDAANEPIDVRHYQAAGSIAQALSLHADSVFASLPDDTHRTVAKKLFKALTERTSDNREIRRPQKLATLSAIAGADPDKVTTVIDAYRQPGVTFLMPTAEVALTPDTVIDISHESLMRVWSRLRAWVDEESQSARIYARLLDTARLWKQEKASLYHDPDLGIAHAWRDGSKPTPAWADLYGGGFDTAIAFLDASQAEAERQLLEQEEARQRELAQAKALAESKARTAALLKRFAATVAVALVIAVGLSVYAFKLKGIADAQTEIATNKASEAQLASEEAELATAKAHLAQGKTSLAIARAASLAKSDFPSRMLAARAIGFKNFGTANQPPSFAEDYPEFIPADQPEWTEASNLAGQGERVVPAWFVPRFRQHPAAISTLAVHPGGNIAASGGESTNDIYLWDLATGHLIRTLQGHTVDVEALAFTHDGSTLASAADAGDRNVIFWGTATWTETKRAEIGLEGTDSFGSGIHYLSYSPDDSILAAGDENGNVFLIDPADGSVRHPPQQIHSARTYGVSYSPDGTHIASCSNDGTLQLIDPQTLEPRQAIPLDLPPDNLQVSSFAFSPDSAWMVASAFRNNPEIWDISASPPVRTGRLLDGVIADNPGFNIRTNAVAISSDGSRIAVSWNDNGNSSATSLFARPTVSVFDSTDPLNPRHLHDHVGHAANVRTLDFIPGTHRYLAGDDAGLITFRDADTPPSQLAPLPGHSNELTTAAVSPDGRWFVTADTVGNAFVWNAATGTVATALADIGDRLRDACFSPDSHALYTTAERTASLHVWQIPSGKHLQTVALGYQPSTAALAPDGRTLAVCGHTLKFSVFDVADDGTLSGETIVDNTHQAGQIGFLPDGRIIITGGSDSTSTIGLFARDATGAWTATSKQSGFQEAGVSSTSIHPDGDNIAVSSWRDGLVTFWQIDDNDSLTQLHNIVLRGIENTVPHIAYSPDGSRLLTCGTENIQLWDSATGELLASIREPHSPQVAEFTPDGRYIFAADRAGSLRLWDLGGSGVITRWENPTTQANESQPGPWGLAYLEGYKKLAMAGGFADGPNDIRIWDFETRAFTRTLSAPGNAPFRRFVFSPDGTMAAAATTTGHVKKALGAVLLFDLTAPPDTPPFTLYRGSGAYSLAFHPDGNIVAAAFADREVRLFHVPDLNSGAGPSEGTVVGDSDDVAIFRDVLFTPEGKQLAVGNRDGVRLYPLDPSTLELGEPTVFPQNWGIGAAASPDGTFIASISLSARTLVTWDPNTRSPYNAPYNLPELAAQIWLSPDTHFIAVTCRYGELLVFDVSDIRSPVVLIDRTYTVADQFTGIRDVAFGPDSRSLAVSVDDGSVELLEIPTQKGANDLTRYLDVVTFNDAGNVAWRNIESPTLSTLPAVFPPSRAAAPYLGFLTPGPDTHRQIFEHHIAANNLAAAEAALRAFPPDSPPTDTDWATIGDLLVSQLRDSLAGHSTPLSPVVLNTMASRISGHFELPPDVQLASLLEADQWRQAEELLLSTLPDLSPDARSRLVRKFFDATTAAIQLDAEPTPEPSDTHPTAPSLPAHLALATIARYLASDTAERWAPGYQGRHVPAGSAANLHAALADHALAGAPPLVTEGATWSYFRPDNPAPDGWNQPGFDDTSWPSGPADIGFGGSLDDEATLRTRIRKIPDRITYYFRHSFTLDRLPDADTLTLFLQRDDGAVIYLNGTEILRDNIAPGPVADDTRAIRSVGGSAEFTFFPFTVPAGGLRLGTNTVAVEIHQSSPSSSDIHFDLAVTPTPLVSPQALGETTTLLAALGEAGTSESWLPVASAILGQPSPGEDIPATIARTRFQSILGDPHAELATLGEIATRLRDSSQPADWARYRDVLRRRESILRQLGRETEADRTQDAIVATPARPPGLPDTLLDLTRYYNSSLYDSRGWMPTNPNVDLANVPSTITPHNGVSFDVRGIIQLDSGVYQTDDYGNGAFVGRSLSAIIGRPFPTRIDGIPVGRTASALHVLGAAVHVRLDDSTEIGQVVLNYADGTHHTVALVQNENISDMWSGAADVDQSIVAWQSTNGLDGATHSFWLADITCTNPHPEKVISSFDLVSAGAQAGFFITSATIEP